MDDDLDRAFLGHLRVAPHDFAGVSDDSNTYFFILLWLLFILLSCETPAKSCGEREGGRRRHDRGRRPRTVPTANWTRGDLDEWVSRTRQLYVDTLDDSPGVEAGKKWSAAIAQASAVAGGMTNDGAVRRGDAPEIATLLNSTESNDTTAQLASKLGRSAADVRPEAANYVRDIAASMCRTLCVPGIRFPRRWSADFRSS